MLRRVWVRRQGRRFVALVTAAVTLTVAGCSGGSDRSDGQPASTRSSPPPTGPVDVLQESKATVEVAYKGTYNSPDKTPRPAAKGKKIAIVSAGQLSPTNAIPVAGATEAARALGWQVLLFDLQLNRAAAPRVMKDVLASNVDAIVANFDCLAAPAEFADAKARGIKIIPLYGFDCDDRSSDKPGPAQFTTFINYGQSLADAPTYTAGFGVMGASAIIAATNGTAKVINFNDPTITALRYIEQGFQQQMARCAGCKVVETVEFTGLDLAGALHEKVAAALRRHPDATVVRAPYSAALQLAIAPVLVKSGRHTSMLVFGGEGFPADLDLIRTRQGLNSALVVDSEWTGWAVVDSLNSAFTGEEPRWAGFGTILVDREHNLPPSGPVRHNVDYKSIYRRAWGVA